MSHVAIDVFGISDVGLTKEVNEDSFVYKIAEVNGKTELAGYRTVSGPVRPVSRGSISGGSLNFPDIPRARKLSIPRA